MQTAVNMKGHGQTSPESTATTTGSHFTNLFPTNNLHPSLRKINLILLVRDCTKASTKRLMFLLSAACCVHIKLHHVAS